MKPIYVIIVGVLFSVRVQAQFTQIPTRITANIGGITLHSDTLILEQPSNGTVQLLDLTSHVVIPLYDGPFSNGESVYKVDVDTLPSSIYIYRIMFQDGTTIHQKTIKN